MLKSYVVWNFPQKHEWVAEKEYNDGTRMFRALTQRDFGNTIDLTPQCKEVVADIRFDKRTWERDIVQAGELCDLAHQMGKTCILKLWYVPNARMDRIQHENESFTLKTYCKLVNAMGFDEVRIFDPHSDVAPALLDRCKVIKGEVFRRLAVGKVLENEGLAPVIVYPDAGAEHRYGGAANDQFIVGFKQRDWLTSYVKGYMLTNPEKMEGRPVLIFDDIVAHGYTMKFLIEEIEKHPHGQIYICTSHLEQSYFDTVAPLHKLCIEKGVNLITTDSIDHSRYIDPASCSTDYITEMKLDEIYGEGLE